MMRVRSKNEIMETTISALLHDIGKFYQRTGIKLGDDQLDNSFVGKYGAYKHAAFTSKFISNFLPQLNKLIYHSASHHQEKNEISKADELASAHDRKCDVEEDEEYTSGRYDYILKRLNSIFNEIKITKESQVDKKYVTISKIDEFDYLAKSKEEDIDEAKRQYKKIFEEFAEECKKLNDKNDIISLHHKLYPLLKKYTTSIPSATYQKGTTNFKPTVSLFDHLKLTAAIAACLKSVDYKYGENRELEFVFLEYDLSGTQNFIYRITEGERTKKDIAKSLRTRSFFLVLLTDLVGYKILELFNLSYENLLLSTGGRGIILLPKNDDFDQKIKETISVIEEEIYNQFKGEISFAIAMNTIKEKDFESYYDKIMSPDKKEVLVSKKQKFITLLSSKKIKYVNKPIEKVCELCENNDAIQPSNRCMLCNKLIELNSILVSNNQLIIEYDFANKATESKITFAFGKLGNIKIYTKEPTIDNNNFYLSINSHNLGESKYYANLNASGNTFSDIAEKSKGDKKLAVLKMDVDNLGLIFSKGLSKEYKTFSKILTLSRVMDYFFSKKLYDFLASYDSEKSIYINYSGGDDLVIITPASNILEITSLIIQKFKEYTGNNNDLHLSSGIEIFPDKSPVRYAIKKADENLSLSKEEELKNSFTIFETTLPNDKIDDVIDISNYYIEKIESNQISRGLIFKINDIISNSLDSKNPLDNFVRFIPQLAYSFARNITNEEDKNKLKEIFVKTDLNLDVLKLYKVALTYTLLKTRKGGGKNEQE